MLWRKVNYLFPFRLINCKPADSDTSTKPGAMIEFEAESMKFRNQKMYEADFFTGDKGPGSVRIEIKPVSTEGEIRCYIL